MIAGLLGKKLGMTQVFQENGTLVPVTVIQAGPCIVMQVKTKETDGYNAVQLGFEDRKRKNATKPDCGHARKAETEPKRFIREIRGDEADVALGATVSVDIFAEVRSVDVVGVTKGKGFQGVIKRHNFRGQGASHGASKIHRAPGSIGSVVVPLPRLQRHAHAGPHGPRQADHPEPAGCQCGCEQELVAGQRRRTGS